MHSSTEKKLTLPFKQIAELTNSVKEPYIISGKAVPPKYSIDMFARKPDASSATSPTNGEKAIPEQTFPFAAVLFSDPSRRGTLHTFTAEDAFHNPHFMDKIAMSKHSALSKHDNIDTINMKKKLRMQTVKALKRDARGSMYSSELWDRNYYKKMLKNTGLEPQIQEIKKSKWQGKEYHLKWLENGFYKRHPDLKMMSTEQYIERVNEEIRELSETSGNYSPRAFPQMDCIMEDSQLEVDSDGTPVNRALRFGDSPIKTEESQNPEIAKTDRPINSPSMTTITKTNLHSRLVSPQSLQKAASSESITSVLATSRHRPKVSFVTSRVSSPDSAYSLTHSIPHYFQPPSIQKAKKRHMSMTTSSMQKTSEAPIAKIMNLHNPSLAKKSMPKPKSSLSDIKIDGYPPPVEILTLPCTSRTCSLPDVKIFLSPRILKTPNFEMSRKMDDFQDGCDGINLEKKAIRQKIRDLGSLLYNPKFGNNHEAYKEKVRKEQAIRDMQVALQKNEAMEAFSRHENQYFMQRINALQAKFAPKEPAKPKAPFVLQRKKTVNFKEYFPM